MRQLSLILEDNIMKMETSKSTAPSGLVINIYTNAVPVTDISSRPSPVKKMGAPESTERSKSATTKKVNKDVERGNALDVELMARDSMADEEKIDLEQRVTLYVREMLRAKKMSVVRDFLDKAKHHLDKELKESIAEEITMFKKDL